MTFRTIAAASLAATLIGGCASASPRPAIIAAAPDPERWEKVACRRGEYPRDLDAMAFARARLEDVRARQNGEWSSFASARLEGERGAFHARCAGWRAAAVGEEQERPGAAAVVRLARDNPRPESF
jgi:hypothetical protein